MNYAKFGILVGLAESDQVVYQSFKLKGSYFGLHYFPSTLLAYFRPDGLRLMSVFPFITLPSQLAQPAGSILLYGSDWVASVPAAMPLLFLLAIWGIVRTVRPGGGTSSFRIRIVLATAAAAGATVMVYGWIANRFVGDLIPVIVMAAALGMIDLWRYRALEGRLLRRLVLIAVAVLGLFGVAANTGAAASFQGNWSSTQLQNYVGFQRDVSDITGHPLDGQINQGSALPLHASAGQLFIAGNCDGLYRATGLSGGSTLTSKATLLQQIGDVNLGWVSVEQSSSIRHTVVLSVRAPVSTDQDAIPLATVGTDHVSTLAVEPSGPGAIRFAVSGPGGISTSQPTPVRVGATYRFTVVVDTYLHFLSIASQGTQVFHTFLLSTGPVVQRDSPPSASHPLSVSFAGRSAPLPPDSLCQRIR